MNEKFEPNKVEPNNEIESLKDLDGLIGELMKKVDRLIPLPVNSGEEVVEKSVQHTILPEEFEIVGKAEHTGNSVVFIVRRVTNGQLFRRVWHFNKDGTGEWENDKL